ncbi:alpha/beta hydrolase fold protein [Rhodococcus opacus M213]|uniref:Alpha/beta hydrolase fold protein n=1 Tax=Rhodococcus opacus M213 TaxID=1129896 RepID=K8X9S9_RHOOP|nr:alpha/beta fold hydrolase [Rhodococcus opacus]EKT78283.1 alpha/beta hydrolase fold protein [Rhodococcus opacus M213]
MTIVLVHGNPETDVIWRPMLRELGRDDVICLSPPGYGAPVPDRFGASWIEYRDWLISELEAIGHPVHLVGHDWGGVHVMNTAMSRPDLLLSWTIDVMGGFDPEYVWHDLAQEWRTIDSGEAATEAFLGETVEDRIQTNLSLGIPEETAKELAVGQDQTMMRCLLALYRSAPEPILKHMAAHLADASAVPGLVVIATEDNFVGNVEMRRRAAVRTGATVVELPLQHWWMLQDPKLAAETLTNFWSSVPVADAHV